jgi:hypothetical protein
LEAYWSVTDLDGVYPLDGQAEQESPIRKLGVSLVVKRTSVIVYSGVPKSKVVVKSWLKVMSLNLAWVEAR